MNVLTINCGSSSLKLALCSVDGAGVTSLARGAVEAIGDDASIVFESGKGPKSRSSAPVKDHGDALRRLLDLLGEERRGSIHAIGHRIVQGGAFAQPATIDDEVVHAIEAGRRLAPLHNGPSLEGINAARESLPNIAMVAVFDTTFHATIPSVAAQYALPQEWTLKHGLRRYGYHGIAHRSMTERYAELTGTPHDGVCVITLQLGNGCSATAVDQGVSIDTSMGFTPLEGLMMGTRPGDVDPGALSYLLREEGLSPDELDEILNTKSGLLGVSGTTGDMASLLREEAQGHPRAHAAIEMFCYRVRKYIGAYLAVLGGADAIVFGGGIGERSAEIRRRICEPLRQMGIDIDGARNTEMVGDGRFSCDESAIAAWVIGSDEERIIAQDTFDVVAK